jgi:uncharacterized protein (DUF305 family)
MKTFTAFVAAAATALFLSSCTSPASDGHTDHEHGAESSSVGFNDADVAFATGMIPHHQQAVEMSAMVPTRSTNPEVIKLAADISAAQGPEIETMKGFLTQWNKSLDSGHEGHDTGGMQGMVDGATMTRLESLKGNDFDTLWLTSMIGHHEGAIGMADSELAAGVSADAKKLAGQIVTVQKAEIVQMKKMGTVTQGG